MRRQIHHRLLCIDIKLKGIPFDIRIRDFIIGIRHELKGLKRGRRESIRDDLIKYPEIQRVDLAGEEDSVGLDIVWEVTHLQLSPGNRIPSRLAINSRSDLKRHHEAPLIRELEGNE